MKEEISICEVRKGVNDIYGILSSPNCNEPAELDSISIKRVYGIIRKLYLSEWHTRTF